MGGGRAQGGWWMERRRRRRGEGGTFRAVRSIVQYSTMSSLYFGTSSQVNNIVITYCILNHESHVSQSLRDIPRNSLSCLSFLYRQVCMGMKYNHLFQCW